MSDTFIFDDVVRYAAHVDALTEQGVTLRFILVTPWGWVELPLNAIGKCFLSIFSLFLML